MKKIIFFATWVFSFQAVSAQKSKNGNILLGDGWFMQSVLEVKESGKELSQKEYAQKNWNRVSIPSTIIAGLLKDKKYDFDPFFGDNLQRIAGKQFDTSWWFRKSFKLPAAENGKNVTLILHGINYRANIWLNGILVADDKQIVGPFRFFELDITKLIRYKGPNILAIEVTRPFNPNKRGGDLAIDYADWIHYPADFNGGIINDVEISTCQKVAIRHPLVSTRFDLPSLSMAHLTVEAELYNYSDKEEEVLVAGKINEKVSFQQKLTLRPGERENVVFNSKDYPQLNIRNPKVWWPWQYGKPALNTITLKVIRKGITCSSLSDHFGIRQMSSELIDNKSRKFIVNGKPILLRGAAWSPDIFQRRSPKRQEQEIRLVRDMNMNLIRSEGKLEDDNFYDICDRYGMLVMSGWMCCGSWQYPEQWDSIKRNIAMESARSVVYWLRNKACLLVWLNGSDMPPGDTTVERDFLAIEHELNWPNIILATADASPSKVSGYSGVKMNGPYDWVPPIYWETDSNKHGGAWSFATEISPGPSIPPYESLVRFIPVDSLTFSNSLWLYHCGTMEFGNTNIFDHALSARYGPSVTMQQYVKKAQVQNYEGHRAMMEAFGLNKYHDATGVVQWMLNNPWPSLIWHAYDYYLYPGGTYFGIKKSLELVHVQYSYKSAEVSVVNSTLQSIPELQVKADCYGADGVLRLTRSSKTSVGKDTVLTCFSIPELKHFDSISFLRLELKDKSAKSISTNWYWLSQKNDSLDWAKSKWFYTPQSAFASFGGLENLPLTALDIRYDMSINGGTNNCRIQIRNSGRAIAFFVHLRLLEKKGGGDILPVIFEDNYICLAPGESRTIHCSYLRNDAKGNTPFILAQAWNLDFAHSKASGNTGFSR